MLSIIYRDNNFRLLQNMIKILTISLLIKYCCYFKISEVLFIYIYTNLYVYVISD